jgi:1,4-dihydroxy-2-naphthoate octaprenyltransferase
MSELAAPSPGRVWLAAARPRTLPAAVAPVLVGSALAFHDGHLGELTALLCLAFALLVQIGANFANDYYDFVQGADTTARLGPRRAVASGWVSPAAMRRAMVATLAAAILAGGGLIWRGGPWMAAVGFGSVLCAIAYTGGPFPLGYHGLGDLFVFIFFGLVAVTMTYFVQTGWVSREAVLAAVPMGLLTANILVVNNYRDMETDAAAGKRTLVVVFGRGFARIQYALSLLIALAVPVLFWRVGFGAGSLLPLVLAPLGWRLCRRLQAGRTPPELIALLGDTAKLVAAYALLFAVGINL